MEWKRWRRDKGEKKRVEKEVRVEGGLEEVEGGKGDARDNRLAR